MSRSSILLEIKRCAGITAYLWSCGINQIEGVAIPIVVTNFAFFLCGKRNLCPRALYNRGTKEYHGVLLS